MPESTLYTIQAAALAAFTVLIFLAAVLGWCGLETDAFVFVGGAALSLVVGVVVGVVDAHG